MVFLAGLLSILVQVILLRELAAAFYGIDLIYALALGAWLFWTAIGAGIRRRSRSPSSYRVAFVLGTLGCVVPADVLLLRALHRLLGGVPGAFLPLPVQLASSFLCLMPPSMLLGLLFQWVAKQYLSADVRRTTARAYAIESAGAVSGGLVTALAVSAGVQNLTLALAASGIALGAAVVKGRADAANRFVLGLASLLLAASAVGMWYAPRLDMWSTRWNHPDAVAAADTVYGRVTVTKRAGQIGVYTNDALAFESEGTDAEEFLHLALAQHPSPRRVLLVGGASADLIRYALQHGPGAIDDVDLNERQVRLMRRWLPEGFGKALGASGVHVSFGDARRTVAGCRTAACDYDAILVAAAEPSSAMANRYFTREFFADCAAGLAPGGVLALRLPSVENAWTPQLVSRAAGIYGALRSVFRDVVVLPGSANSVLASQSALTRDPDVLGARLTERGIHARLATPRYVRYLYSNDRYAEIQARLARARAPMNTDASPASYQATALVWLSKFVPSAAYVDLSWITKAFGWTSWVAWTMLGGLVALALLARHARQGSRAPAVAAGAFAGMSIECVLLVHYQLKHGVVFRDLGLLFTAVMVGLAVGAWVVGRPARRTRLAWPALTALAVVAIGCSVWIRAGFGAGLLAVALVLALSGVAVGAVFGWASGGHRDQQSAVSPIYAADVIGGAVGSLFACLVSIPLLGLPLSLEWTAAIAACVALASSRRRQG